MKSPAILISHLARLQSNPRGRPTTADRLRGEAPGDGGATPGPRGGTNGDEGAAPAGGGARWRGEGRGWGGGHKVEGVGDVGVLGFAPPLFGRPPHGPQLGPTAAPPFGLQGCPPWPTRPPLGPAGPKAQVQNRKNRRNAEIANFKFEFEPNSF